MTAAAALRARLTRLSARLDPGKLEVVLAYVVHLRPDLAALPERHREPRWCELDAAAAPPFDD